MTAVVVNIPGQPVPKGRRVLQGAGLPIRRTKPGNMKNWLPVWPKRLWPAAAVWLPDKSNGYGFYENAADVQKKNGRRTGGLCAASGQAGRGQSGQGGA